MTNKERLEKIDALLAQVPSFECRQGCADCCGPIEMSRLEYYRVVKASGRNAGEIRGQMERNLKRGNYRCPMLHPKTNRCTVYQVRPAICRLFGVVKDKMLCPHGCGADVAERLSDEQVRIILDSVEELGR